MKRLCTTLAAALAAAFAALAGAVPRVFEADVLRPGTFQTSAYHGETLSIKARLVEGRERRPFAIPEGAGAQMLVSTNGADWWGWPATAATGGVVRAAWTPDMDCGADAYRVFLAVSEGGTNVVYGANMLLRMLGSPGAVPNELPLPAKSIDFSRVAWTNAPWVAAEADPVFAEWASTNGIAADLVELHSGVRYNAEAIVDIFERKPDNRDLADVAFSGEYGDLWGAPDLDQEIELRGLVISNDLGSAAWHDAGDFATRQWTLSVYGDTNKWMAIDGDLLGIYSATDGGSGTNTLWESSSAMGEALGVVASRATNNTVRIAALEARPDLTSWGDYAPDGTPNPDAEAMVYLNKALTLMGSGFSWATSGAYACLCQSGAVAFQVETNGEIRIGVDVQTNYFGIVQGGSVTIGCRTDGISVANGIAYLEYAYAGGDFPVVWFCGDIVEGAWQETSPVWVDNGDGTATAAVPATGPKGFWKATTSRQTGAYFQSNIPAHFPGGVYGDLASPPVKYNSVITIQSGGRSYRVPAELVQ